MQAIGPQLIALRVLERRAWRKESTSQFLTTINFSDRTAQTTTRGGGSKTEFELENKKDASSSLNLPTLRTPTAADDAV